MSDNTEITADQYEAVAELYHAYLTGLLLYVNTHKGAKAAGDITLATFRHQHKEKFLSSFEKLGLDGLPPAVAAARYHYLSNSIGGVGVEYMYENDRKAWVRFRHPRWIYDGTALAGMPIEVSHGFLYGWYAQNGVSLNNPRLGFVCTSQDMDGQYGLAGYFHEYDRDLEPHERLRFSPGEEPPKFDPDALPLLDTSTWPAERLMKANRNYSMEYIKTLLPEMTALFGPMEAQFMGSGAGQLIGKQFYTETARLLGISGDTPGDFGEFMTRFGTASGDDVSWQMEGDAAIVTQSSWRLMRGRGAIHHSTFDAWNGLWQGLLSMHNRFLAIEVLSRMDYGDDAFVWRIRERGKSRVG